MKKRRLALSLIAFFGVVVLAIVAAVYLGERPPVRFRFLDGKEPMWRRTRHEKETMDYYRFEGDYDRVSAEAAAELAHIGFRRSGANAGIYSSPAGYDRSCVFRLRKPTYHVDVLIGESEIWVHVRVRVLTLQVSLRDRLRYFFSRLTGRRQTGRTRSAPQGGQ